MNDQNMRG